MERGAYYKNWPPKGGLLQRGAKKKREGMLKRAFDHEMIILVKCG